MDEKDVDLLNGARQAGLAFDLLKPFLNREREMIITKMKSLSREGKHELGVYVGMVLTLTSLDDLESKILKTIKGAKDVR